MLLRCLPQSFPFSSPVILKSRLTSIQEQNITGQHSLNSVKNTITCVHQLLWPVNMQGKKIILLININGVFVLINKKALIMNALIKAQ